MIIDILTLFPGMFAGPFDSSIIKRARDRGLLEIDTTDIRGFSGNKHNTSCGRWTLYATSGEWLCPGWF